MSFHDFRSTVREIAADLGGVRFQMAVADQMNQFLGLAMASRKEDRYGGIHSAMGNGWVLAWDEDFYAATIRSRLFFAQEREKAIATAQWQGTTLELCGHDVVVRGPTYSMVIAWAFRSDTRYRSDPVEQWQISFNNAGARCVNGSDSSFIYSSKPSTVHAKTEAGAVKSLRSIVERFCGVTFSNVAD